MITTPDRPWWCRRNAFPGTRQAGGTTHRGSRTDSRPTLPEAKIFWIVRHQAEAIRSEYKQIVLAGWPGDLKTTLAPAPRMKTTGIDLAYWEYDRLLSAYAQRFGRENVKVIDFGRFTRDSGEVCSRIWPGSSISSHGPSPRIS